MSVFSYPGGAASLPGQSTLTFKRAKQIVANIVSSGRDPEAVGASDAIFLAFSWLMRPIWGYTGVTIDITLVNSAGLTAGQEGYLGTYSLPTEVRSPYSVLVGFGLTGAARPETPLDYIDQRLIDSFVGHTTEEMRKRYTHLFPSAKKAAIEAVFGAEGLPV